MNFKKNKTLVAIVVIFVAIGLVLAYVPLLFAPSVPDTSYYPDQEKPEIPATASIGDSIIPEPTEDYKTAVDSSVGGQDAVGASEENTNIPDSFSGLEEESESLDGLLDL